MTTATITRLKCYLIIQGIERSLAENLKHHFDWETEGLLNPFEQEKALGRLRDDLGEQAWDMSNIRQEDLIQYLDVGELVGLLGRHADRAANILPNHIKALVRSIEDSSLIAIRKRVMHPVRPLEPTDLPDLVQASKTLQSLCPSLIWDPLEESTELLVDNAEIFDITIPPFWKEESVIDNNLPPADFDDTGFVGRSKEREELKRHIESDQRVWTIVGEGGKGKTALALRVCNDLVEENSPLFDRIIWVSLKTKHLTSEGVREIQAAVDSVGALVQTLLEIVGGKTASGSWDHVIEALSKSKNLLVIDNLETVGEELRDLLVDVPRGSKVLLTSRIGLGELERRYELPDFSAKDAARFFRSVGNAYGYSSLRQLSADTVEGYCGKLGYNPMLIKWFVQSVGKGVDPEAILSHGGRLDEALHFCYSNVYEKLIILSKELLAYLLAARQPLTTAQLQELAGVDYVEFTKAYQDLMRSSYVERILTEGSSPTFQVTGLLRDYLSKDHAPSDEVVNLVRERLREWQIERERSVAQATKYRYATKNISVSTPDELIAAKYLRMGLQAGQIQDYAAASEAVNRAQELAPGWWEVFRIRAHLLQMRKGQIFDIEEAYEDALRCSDNDIVRFHYAAYLMRQGQYDRALTNLDFAIEMEAAELVTLRSLRGLILVRMGQVEEGIKELEYVWHSRDKNVPMTITMLRGTQLADAYKRRAEQLWELDRPSDGFDWLRKAAYQADATMDECGFDPKVVAVSIDIVGLGRHRDGENQVQQELTALADKWDSNEQFVNASQRSWDVVRQFKRVEALETVFPNLARTALSFDTSRRFTGVVRMVDTAKKFGFIAREGLGDVHFGQSSLIAPGKWSEIATGVSVSFGTFAVKGRDLPSAVAMEINEGA